MRNVLLILSVLILGLANTQCSSDNNDATAQQNSDHTLWVNDIPFVIGTNQPEALYNTTMFMGGTGSGNGISIRTFVIANKMESASDAKIITLAVAHPNTQTGINGTYPIIQTFSTSEKSAIFGYTDSDGSFGGDEYNAAGSVTITDHGNNNFKLVFNNVVAQGSTSTATKTLTGYCQPAFAVIPAPGKK